jgi:hypothetical protein
MAIGHSAVTKRSTGNLLGVTGAALLGKAEGVGIAVEVQWIRVVRDDDQRFLERCKKKLFSRECASPGLQEEWWWRR